jgi:hypothetical protein
VLLLRCDSTRCDLQCCRQTEISYCFAAKQGMFNHTAAHVSWLGETVSVCSPACRHVACVIDGQCCWLAWLWVAVVVLAVL